MIKFLIFDVGGILFQGAKQLAVDIARDVVGGMTNDGERESILTFDRFFRPVKKPQENFLHT